MYDFHSQRLQYKKNIVGFFINPRIINGGFMSCKISTKR